MKTSKEILVRVPAEVADALKAERVRTGVPTSEFIRRSIAVSLFVDHKNQTPATRIACAEVMTKGEPKPTVLVAGK
jgi:hypothetical protein